VLAGDKIGAARRGPAALGIIGTVHALAPTSRSTVRRRAALGREELADAARARSRGAFANGIRTRDIATDGVPASRRGCPFARVRVRRSRVPLGEERTRWRRPRRRPTPNSTSSVRGKLGLLLPWRSSCSASSSRTSIS
jgi:hypothetical protein